MPDFYTSTAERLTPATEAWQQQQAAVAESNQQASSEDVIAGQERTQQQFRQQLKEQAAAAESAQRQQEAEQEKQAAAQRTQVANAKRAGVKTTMGADGIEQIQKHADDSPVFEHGFQGMPRQTADGHVVPYRDPHGRGYHVPVQHIRTTQDAAGAPECPSHRRFLDESGRHHLLPPSHPSAPARGPRAPGHCTARRRAAR